MPESCFNIVRDQYQVNLHATVSVPLQNATPTGFVPNSRTRVYQSVAPNGAWQKVLIALP